MEERGEGEGGERDRGEKERECVCVSVVAMCERNLDWKTEGNEYFFHLEEEHVPHFSSVSYCGCISVSGLSCSPPSVCICLSVGVICFVLVLFLLLWNLPSEMKLLIYPKDKLSGKSVEQKSIASAGSAIALASVYDTMSPSMCCVWTESRVKENALAHLFYS